MRRIKRKKTSFKFLLIVFIVSTFTLSVGYSLLYETLSVKGIGNLVFKNDQESSSEYLKFTYTTNSWYSEGKYYYQIDGVLENISQYTIEDWKVILQFPENITLQGGWNGEFLVDGNKLTITPAIYNSSINPNSSINIGFQIIILSDKLQIDKTILNGTPIGVASNNQEVTDTNDSENSENESDISSDTEEDNIEIPDDSNNDENTNTENNNMIQSSDLTISTSLKAEWLSGDVYISQYDFVITNETESAIEDWIIQIRLPENVSFSQIWGANYINANGILKVSGIDYNKTIQPTESTNILIQFESNTEGFVPEIISE